MSQVPTTSPRMNPYVPAAFTVVRRRRDTADTFTLQLRPQGGGGFAFHPGQFNMLSVAGVGEVPISMCSAPGQVEIVEHTIRAVGAVTRRLVDLKAGDGVGVRGPFGRGWPLEAAQGRDVIIVAGGIGLAPLRPAILHVLARREAYGRLIVLYGTRTPADLLYRRDLARWRGRLDMKLGVTVDRADPTWRGNVGVVTTLLHQVERLFDPANTIVMMCGPEVMMRFTVRELQQRGLPDDHMYLSLERNMKCALAFCGHCQYGPYFICKDGPVFSYDRIGWLFTVREM